MPTLIKRPLHVFSNKLRRRQPAEWMKEKWIADFTKPEKSGFIIKPEISYNAYLEKGVSRKKSSLSKGSGPSKEGVPSKRNALFLGLKKKNRMAWLETAHRVYVDQIIEARFRFDNSEGYCAAGIMFRVTEQGSYYLILISSKGYFRLDVVNNNIPRSLVGWTEAPGLNDCAANLKMIAHGEHLIAFLNGKWIAEAYDASIPGGHLGFALVSYDEEDILKITGEEYACRAWLDFLSVDSRTGAVEAEYEKWDGNIEIGAESRFRLAESLATLDYFDAAHSQILKIWKRREEAIKNIMATYTETRNRKELLFAARMASQLGHYATAEEYINICLTMCIDRAEELIAYAEKAKILSVQHKYSDLAAFLPDYIQQVNTNAGNTDIPPLYALLGHAHWNLKNYKAAAAAWGKAFSLDGNNGLYAASAAKAFEQTGKKTEALQHYVDGAHCFLRQKDYAELGALVPKLLAAGKNKRHGPKLAAVLQAAAKVLPDNEDLFAYAASNKQPKPVNARTTPGRKAVKKPTVRAKAKPAAAGKTARK
jgi:tetratricopeptide (TPR) repeat protein